MRGYSGLMGALSDQGKYEQMEEMDRRALGLRETVLGKENPDTLASMSNLELQGGISITI
jgi:hypothetical protein